MKVKITQENLNDLKKKGIYRIYCTKSNKSYIGSTWKSFKSRWKQHLYKLNNNNPIVKKCKMHLINMVQILLFVKY